MNSLVNQRVVVMGLGRFGGGVGVTRFLVEQGAHVLVTDCDPPDKLRQSLDALAGLPADRLNFRLGGHEEADFTAADLIVVNPAVRQQGNPYLAAARQRGVPTTSEIRLLLDRLPQPRRQTVGVTGTAGKSTTTAMIGHVMTRLAPAANGRRVWVGGNLGGSLLPRLPEIQPHDPVVLELSSFMLEDMALGNACWSPHVAVVTNVTPNHLDRHGTFEAYALAKQQILEHQRPDDAAVLGRPLPHHLIRPRTTHVRYLENLDNMAGHPLPRLLVPGSHNLDNARLAIEAAAALGFDRHAAAQALADFAGLKHRLQFVAEHAGVRYFNDSKATTPEAAILALGSFPAGTVHVILGGYDKGSDMSALANLAARHAHTVYTIGQLGPTLADLIEAHGPTAEVVRCGTLDQALARIRPRVRDGQVVLLSPGCASYDQFANYEQRGDAFGEAVLRYTGE